MVLNFPSVSSSFLSKMTPMVVEFKGAPSRMLSHGLTVKSLGNITNKLSIISGVEVMISHLERLRYPRDSQSSFARARSADRDLAMPAKLPSSKTQMFSSPDRLSTTSLKAR